MQLFSYAKLTDAQLAKIKAFEAETGKTALVLRDARMDAEVLSAEEMEQLQALEQELGYVIVVVK